VSSHRGTAGLVDLAGSERSSKTGITEGQRMTEAKNINRSLTTLSLVIKVRHLDPDDPFTSVPHASSPL
jgi:hypothetical protein